VTSENRNARRARCKASPAKLLHHHFMYFIPPKLMAHAKLWAFAHCYNIPRLEQLSLFKLHQELCNFLLDEQSAKVVVNTIEVAYANTPDAESAREVPLRDLLLNYIVCYADNLVKVQEFRDLLRKGGDLASDFAGALVK